MSTQQFKPLYEQAANKLAKALIEKTSPFNRPWSPDNGPNFTIPYNRATGESYKPMNAMILAMQNREDPRWMTKAQARLNDLVVQENATPTLINYMKKSDLQPVLDEHGERIPDENMKPQMKTVELEKPQVANAWLFNGAQIDGLPDWKAEAAERQGEPELSPSERVERLVKNSGAVVIEGGDDAYYKPVADHIQMPEKEKFSVPEKYYAELLHQLTHWTGHESRLNRPMEAVYGSKGYASEELRANIATLMLSSELGIGYNFGKHAAYADNWSRMLKNEPFELVKATNDAQKIVDRIMGYEQQIEQKQEASQSQATDRLAKGDVIQYNGSEFKVLAELKNNVFQMQEGDRKFKMSSKDNLYGSLVEAKLNPGQEQERAEERDFEFDEEQGQQIGESMVAEPEASYKVKR